MTKADLWSAEMNFLIKYPQFLCILCVRVAMEYGRWSFEIIFLKFFYFYQFHGARLALGYWIEQKVV